MSAPRVLVSGLALAQPPSGVRRQAQELLPRAARLLARRGGALGLLLPRGGLPFDVADARAVPSDVPGSPVLARALGEGRALARELERARAAGAAWDVVHTAHLPAPGAAHTRGAARSVLVHDLRALALAPRGVRGLARRLAAGPLLARALRGADVVLAVSETVAAELVRRFGVPRERARVVPNAADHLAPLPRAPRAPRAPGDVAPILHVGHVEPRKNLELLVRALALDPGLPPLLLAGAAKGGEGARLAALARELGVAERVTLAGEVDEQRLRELYAACACVALPSRLEGFGIPALEAMLARAPLAVSSAGALPEVAPDAPRFDPDDAAGCARALRAALGATPEQLDRAEARAREASWDRSAELFVAALELAASARTA